ncbi:hypothetical protein Vadar_018824 [Vaccinium darrowii]|uniref:Uncharacterized protein n=1 Tax=Vaccinium darrowii TaxID=229202 RepID=A0ACB7YNG4_9ERIC|nr:hypothetical protein Vadar_018824 [Vaccinium darrowii]
MPPLDKVNFTSLAVLDLSDNEFNDLMPRWIFSLSSLISLNLAGSNFEGSLPNNFWNLTSLRMLDVSYNGLNFKLPNSLWNVNNLISLKLIDIGFKGPIPGGLQNLTNLRNSGSDYRTWNFCRIGWVQAISTAQEIGKAASDFIQEDLKMDYVYDYMFHLLSEYAKLMRYKPTKPRKAIEISSERLACPATGSQKKFMMESIVKGPTDVSPCNMPPPYDAVALRTLLRRKANSVSQVEMWEKRYWEIQTKHN